MLPQDAEHSLNVARLAPPPTDQLARRGSGFEARHRVARARGLADSLANREGQTGLKNSVIVVLRLHAGFTRQLYRLRLGQFRVLREKIADDRLFSRR